MRGGGYDEGYRQSTCFWGRSPASFVVEAIEVLGRRPGMSALDVGCGEGKNASAMALAGYCVTAIDKCPKAIANGLAAFGTLNIEWKVGDLLSIPSYDNQFDLVIATGSLHCLSCEQEVTDAIVGMKKATRPGGVNVLYAFNDGPHDLSGHEKDFNPILIPHKSYEHSYRDWELLKSSTTIQGDIHPHMSIPHSHSITRLMARRPM